MRTFVFASSIAVYGSGGGRGPFDERTPPAPEDPYGVAKYAVELDLAAAREMFGIDTVVFRPHNVYGEFQHTGDRYRNVVGIFMNQILRGEPLTVFGDGSQRRAFTYVRDVAPVVARCDAVPAAAGGVFNVGAGRAHTVNELADAVRRAMGVPGHPVRHLEARNEVHTAVSDHARAQEVFADVLPAETPLEEGLARMAAWVRSVGPRDPTRFSGIEVTRNLPPSWAAVAGAT